MKLALAWLFAVAACDSVLGLAKTVGADAAPPIPTDAPRCVMPVGDIDVFADSLMPCSSWGFVDDANSSTAASGGQLIIVPDANQATTRGGCVANNFIPFEADAGVFVKVATLPGLDEFQFIELNWDTDSTQLSAIGFGPTVRFSRGAFDFGGVPFDATLPWVRVRPSADRTAIVAERSSDAATWIQFAIDQTTPPDSVKLFMYGGMFAAQTNPSRIYFDRLDACP